jgi:Tfp pilus assembly major pilin PilA
MSINQAYKSIQSIKKQLQAQRQHHPSNSVISNNITANTAATSTISSTAKLTSHVLEIKGDDGLIQSTENQVKEMI